MEAAHRQFEANVFGYARFMQAVLPHMREQRSGRIVNIASVLGKISIPGYDWYAASKHAVETLSNTLRSEVMGFGIDVAVIGFDKNGICSQAVGAAQDRRTSTCLPETSLLAFTTF